MIVVILIPLMIAAVLKLLMVTVCSDERRLLRAFFKLSLYEYPFYGYLFCAYLVNCSLLITLVHN